jgi:hypothetical protein
VVSKRKALSKRKLLVDIGLAKLSFALSFAIE